MKLTRFGSTGNCTVELVSRRFRASVDYDEAGDCGWYVVTNRRAYSGALWSWFAWLVTWGTVDG